MAADISPDTPKERKRVRNESLGAYIVPMTAPEPSQYAWEERYM